VGFYVVYSLKVGDSKSSGRVGRRKQPSVAGEWNVEVFAIANTDNFFLVMAAWAKRVKRLDRLDNRKASFGLASQGWSETISLHGQRVLTPRNHKPDARHFIEREVDVNEKIFDLQ
jgi:hypothetical protein